MPYEINLAEPVLEIGRSSTIFSMAAICGNRPKQNSVIKTARKDSIKIIHIFETFSIQGGLDIPAL